MTKKKHYREFTNYHNHKKFTNNLYFGAVYRYPDIMTTNAQLHTNNPPHSQQLKAHLYLNDLVNQIMIIKIYSYNSQLKSKILFYENTNNLSLDFLYTKKHFLISVI